MAETTEPEQKAKALARVETSVCGLVLHNLEDMKTVAQLILQSGLAPDSFKTAEQIFVGLQTGAEIGLKPMQALNSIVIIKGKPTLWGDAALALVKRSGLLRSFSEKITGEGDEMIAVVRSVRELNSAWDEAECVVESTFSVADAKTAKLWNKQGPWQTHPKRMLKYKARAFNLRDNFPDVLFGMHLTEEMYGEEPLSAPESDVLPRNERRSSLAVPSTAVDTTRAPVVTEVKTEPVVEGQEPSRTPVEEVRENLVQELEEVTDAVLATKPDAEEPASDEDKKTEDVKELYVNVNGMYVAQDGKDFYGFVAYVLCVDEGEVSPSKLTEEQLLQIKAYIETSGVEIK